MTTTRLYCPDIECDSCIKVISRTLSNKEGITNFNIKKEYVDVDYDNNKINKDDIANTIKEKGYRADFVPFIRKTFTERFRDFKENKHKYEIEYKMLEYSLYIFLILLSLEALSYLLLKEFLGDFFKKYSTWLLYLDLFIISIGASIWHFKSYRTNITSMLGMMIGMTFGMQSGFMIGIVLGATNGMFVGSMTGMFVGVILGFYTGKCCGIMGSLQGMMAGLMGGIMGGMTGVMMLVDKISWFMPFFAILIY